MNYYEQIVVRKNKEMQTLISKEATFDAGVDKLISLRNILFEQIIQIYNE